MAALLDLSTAWFKGLKVPDGFGARAVLAPVLGALAFSTVVGCGEGGVGDPCIPEEEYRAGFSGFSKDEVSIESRSFQCRTRVCMVHNFQGRVSCPYGQTSEDLDNERDYCRTPDLLLPITVAVAPQLIERRPSDGVYCSCRCAGSQENAPYCECPSGYVCQEILPEDINIGDPQLAGGYCVKAGKTEVPTDTRVCSRDQGNCGEPRDPFQ